MSKHPKPCPSTFTFRQSWGAMKTVACQKHLRHKNREHQHNNIRWSAPISTQEGTK